jgi:putative transposase
MTVTKTFRYRAYPTPEQQTLLAKHFGAKRFVYNYFLNERKSLYLKNKTTLNYYDNAKSLTALKQTECEWMKEINSQSLQAALRDLDVAYNKFFRKEARFPRFKSKRDKQSFRVPQFVKYESGWLTIPKFKQPVKVKEDRPLTGKILFATLSRKPSGKYFVSITVETEHTSYVPTNKEVGVDLGIKDLAICSDGTKHPNIKTTYKHQKKLTYEQRQLSKKIKGSNSRWRQRVKVARVHEKISNIRHNHLHQISSQIVRENQTICCESLAVVNMMKDSHRAKSIADASWGELLRQLQYKSEWNGRTFVQIDRFFPSSKTCNKCKFIKDDLTLDEREWTCPVCGSELDRDLNAAENILEQGLKIYNSGSGTESESKEKREEASPLGESMSHETQPSLVVG